MLPLALGAILLGVNACGGASDPAAVEPATSLPTVSVAATTISESAADDPGDAADDPGDAATVCAELEVVQDLSDEVAQSVSDILLTVGEGTSGSEQETLQAFVDLGDDLEAGLPDLMAAYDRAASAASAEVAEEIRAVADGTALLTPKLADGFRTAAEAGEFVDVEQVLGDPALQAAAQRAGLASLRLDNFTNPTCGFQFSNS